MWQAENNVCKSHLQRLVWVHSKKKNQNKQKKKKNCMNLSYGINVDDFSIPRIFNFGWYDNQPHTARSIAAEFSLTVKTFWIM